MKTKSHNQLPKIDELTNGWIAKQRIRCGKPNCRCYSGDPHEAVYFFTRIGGRLIKRYIRKADVDAVRGRG